MRHENLNRNLTCCKIFGSLSEEAWLRKTTKTKQSYHQSIVVEFASKNNEFPVEQKNKRTNWSSIKDEFKMHKSSKSKVFSV